MIKKYFTREVRVGIMATIAIFVLYFGLNFLKGIDIFSPISYYYASYEDLGGLVPSSPVYIKGLKVGQVEDVKYDFSKKESFVVKISVSKDIQLPSGAVSELYDDGLMGGKAIRLVYKPSAPGIKTYQPGDTIRSITGEGLVAQLSGSLMPKIESLTTQADSLLLSLRMITENKSIYHSLASIEQTTANLSQSSVHLNKLLSNDLPLILGDVKVLTSDFKQVSGNLKKVDFDKTFVEINQTIANLKLLTNKLNSNDGTLGMLLNNKELYINLSNAAASTDRLLVDFQKNPKRYVHFSLFGKKAQ